MNRNLIIVCTLVSAVLYLSPAQAHGPGYGGGAYDGWSGSVSVWSGAPYGPGYSGTLSYGGVYQPAPPYAGAHFYSTCGHWHPRGYRSPKKHAYGYGYAHGYADGYGGSHHGKHKKKHGQHKGRHH